jgi:hypothetical protein
MRILTWLSWLSVPVAILMAATALVCQYGINAGALGAHNLGLAILFADGLAFALVGTFYAVPVLLVLGVISLFFLRHVGYKFLAAAAICASTLAVVSWKLV